MKTVNRESYLSIVWDQWWNNIKNEWFKVEAQQDYTLEDDGESLQAWKAGDHKRSLDLIKQSRDMQGWVDTCKSNQAKKTRVHIVKQPLTPYVAWEIESYRVWGAPAGEDIYLVNMKTVEQMKIPDFMIFDNKVAQLHYKNGWMYKADLYDENDDISKYLGYKNELLKHKQPI